MLNYQFWSNRHQGQGSQAIPQSVCGICSNHSNCARVVCRQGEFLCAFGTLFLVCLLTASSWQGANSSAWTLPELTIRWFLQQCFPLLCWFFCFPSSLLLSANEVPSIASLTQQASFLGPSLLISHCIAPETLAKCFLWWAGGNCCIKMTDYPAASLTPHQGRGDGAYAQYWHLLTPQQRSTCLFDL